MLVDLVARPVAARSAERELEQVHADADPDQRHRDDRRSGATRRPSPHGKPATATRRDLGWRPCPSAPRAAQPDRRRGHALVADRPLALRAREARLAIRVAVAVAGLGGHRRQLAYPVAGAVGARRFPHRRRGGLRAGSGSSSTVIRASLVDAQAILAAGYERLLLLPVRSSEGMRLRRELGDRGGRRGGARNGVVVEGFDVGASSRGGSRPGLAGADPDPPRPPTAPRRTRRDRWRRNTVLAWSLLNLAAARGRGRAAPGGEVAGCSICARGFRAASLTTTPTARARRIVAELEGERSDGARAAELVSPARSASARSRGWTRRTYGPPGPRGGHASSSGARENLLRP